MTLAASFRETFSLKPHAGEARTSSALDEFAGLALIVSATAYLYFDAFGGVIRFALPAVGLTMLAYSPAGIAIIALLCHFVARLGDVESVKPMLAALESPATFLANSTIASCMPRHSPRYGILLRLA